MVTNTYRTDTSLMVAGEWRTLLATHEYVIWFDDGKLTECTVIEYGEWRDYKPEDLPLQVLYEVNRVAREAI